MSKVRIRDELQLSPSLVSGQLDTGISAIIPLTTRGISLLKRSPVSERSIHPIKFLAKLSTKFSSAYIPEATRALKILICAVEKYEETLEEAFTKSNITLDHFMARVTDQITLQIADFHGIIDDATEKDHVFVEKAVDSTIDALEDIVVDVGATLNINSSHIRVAFEDLRQPLKNTVLLVVTVLEEHPCLLEVATMGFMMEFPGIFIVRSFLQLLGFSITGPVKGSIAAGIQSKVYGGKIPKASWFSGLQKAGMTSLKSKTFGSAALVAAIYVHCHL